MHAVLICDGPSSLKPFELPMPSLLSQTSWYRDGSFILVVRDEKLQPMKSGLTDVGYVELMAL